MQAIAIACSVLFVIVDLGQAQDDGSSSSLYTKRYERLDIDTILASPRLVTNYVECLLNKKPCAPEGKALKRILPEALRTKCGRCQPSQKEIALKVITALYFDYPQYYKALRERWDPSGDYNKRFEEYLRDQKFNSIGGGAELEAGEQAQGSSFSINITQRPTRQGQGAQGQGTSQPTKAQGQGPTQAQDNKPSASTTDEKDLPEILNRFGSDDEDGYDYEAKNTTKPSTQAPPAAQQPSKPQKPMQPQQTQKPQQPAAPIATSAPPSRRPVIIYMDETSNANKRQVVETNRRPRLRSHNGNNSPSSGGSSKPSHGSNSAALPSHTWTPQHNQPAPGLSTTYYLNTQNPVLNIINRITMKFANTAEFIAGMLRAAVPQQQAPIHKDDMLRKFCDRLRKTFMSYTDSNKNKKNHHQRFNY